MSDAGWYKVDSLDGLGIRAYSDYGFSHLYMGPDDKSKAGIVRSAHKILRVQRSEQKPPT